MWSHCLHKVNYFQHGVNYEGFITFTKVTKKRKTVELAVDLVSIRAETVSFKQKNQNVKMSNPSIDTVSSMAVVCHQIPNFYILGISHM